ncbi:hypothetical protein ACFQL9_13455 [Halobaculum lipolyticum]|uniref:DUF3784 domain-containing protein n=1 Tax=Halobaculum lipolyticum TaxID=3032001 RepID=A0ABD5WEU9_9EURY
MVLQAITTPQLGLAGFGIIFVAIGAHLLTDPDRFNWMLYNNKYDSEERRSTERNQEYIRGAGFVLGGIVFLFMAVTW